MSEMQFFLDGYKPAILPEKDKEHHYRLRTFPSAYYKNSRIYFQTQLLKERYLQFMLDNEKWLLEKGPNYAAAHHTRTLEILGMTMGYPPTSIKVFPVPIKERVQINYYGLSFVTKAHLVESNIEWLKSEYPVPSDYPGTIEITDHRPRAFST